MPVELFLNVCSKIANTLFKTSDAGSNGEVLRLTRKGVEEARNKTADSAIESARDALDEVVPKNVPKTNVRKAQRSRTTNVEHLVDVIVAPKLPPSFIRKGITKQKLDRLMKSLGSDTSRKSYPVELCARGITRGEAEGTVPLSPQSITHLAAAAMDDHLRL